MNNGPFAAFENLGIRGGAARPDLPVLDGELLDDSEPADLDDGTQNPEGGDAPEWAEPTDPREPPHDDLDTPCEGCGVTANGRGCLCDDGGDL